MQLVDLLGAGILHLLNNDGLAIDHRDVDAPGKREVEATPKHEDGCLSFSGQSLHDSEGVEPGAENCCVAQAVGRKQWGACLQSQLCEAFSVLEEDNFVLFLRLKDACDAVGHEANTLTSIDRLGHRLAADIDAAQHRHVSEKGSSKDDRGRSPNELPEPKVVYRGNTQQVGQRQDTVGRRCAEPGRSCSHLLVVVVAPDEAVGEVLVEGDGEPGLAEGLREVRQRMKAQEESGEDPQEDARPGSEEHAQKPCVHEHEGATHDHEESRQHSRLLQKCDRSLVS
mmetsp:Transcript_10059/g.22220  ORF Transcript_10059/g.22220 Transcript_10059/m.22220 type:complete len:283 (-) Transcript_10059:386-1234(-)